MANIVVLDSLEQKMVDVGFDEMSLYDKNQLVVNIGSKKGIPYTALAEKDVFDYHKEIKRNLMSEECENTIMNGFKASNGHTYRMNRDDQINMAGQKEMLNEDKETLTVDWKTEDAGYVRHSRDEWIKVYKEGFLFKRIQLGKYETIKRMINSATTHVELLSIKWNKEETA